MKKNNKKEKEDSLSNMGIGRLILQSKEEMMIAMAKGFGDVHKRIDDVENKIEEVDQRLILTKEELGQRITGAGYRMDDLSLNRVKYEDHVMLVKRVDVLEHKVHSKSKK